jgi:tetratricopeptide (TPR) repeat protein
MTQASSVSKLERAVKRYEKAIASLETAIEAKQLFVEHVLDVMTARDAVQTVMRDRSQPHPGRLIRAVKELDLRLKQQSEYINQVARLAEWQEILNPPEKEWWWWLDPITPQPWRDRYDWLWRFFSLVFLTASLSLVVDISARFLSAGPDIAGAFAVIIPSVLTLLAGEGALTKRGQEGIEYILTSLKLEKAWWDEAICFASAFLLAVLFTFWSLIPCIADAYYVTAANNAFEAGRFKIAEEHYNRALKLNPEHTEIYYKLGELYQALHEHNKAIENYKIAWKESPKAADDIASLYLNQQDFRQADDWLKNALKAQIILLESASPHQISDEDSRIVKRFLNQQSYSKVEKFPDLTQAEFNQLKEELTLNDQQFEILKKLAYVYLKKDQYSESNAWLDIGLALTRNDKPKKSIILGYQGWILLKQGRSKEAETPLRNAIALINQVRKVKSSNNEEFNNELATGYCLLAQALEKQNNQPRAKAMWEQCLTYARLNNSDENIWYGMALKSLGKGAKAK